MQERGKEIMQGMILGGIAAAICWIAWRRHNRLLDEQAEDFDSESTSSGFDYQKAREQADRMEDSLRQYEQCNQLINDSIVAIQSGESMPIEITHFDNRGKRIHTTLTDISPEIVNDFAHRLLDVCTERCSSTSPPADD